MTEPTDDMVERLKAGVRECGLHEDNETELFDVDEASELMADAASRIVELESRLSAIGTGWQDIATAPKDGTSILTFGQGHGTKMFSFDANEKPFPMYAMARWSWHDDTRDVAVGPGGLYRKEPCRVLEGWRTEWGYKPTHWMPPPPPPGTAPSPKPAEQERGMVVNGLLKLHHRVLAEVDDAWKKRQPHIAVSLADASTILDAAIALDSRCADAIERGEHDKENGDASDAE